ncbi:MAG: anaerobic ribonucleoside-triphosphate reductase [Spirochaetota bacterium]|nr:anaerobic ribonucleoside-triphosphate reductase [Spirochaetota bacterium]
MKETRKIPVEVYSRIVGYFRPVNQWNNGKKEEFYERKTLKNNVVGRTPLYEHKGNIQNISN